MNMRRFALGVIVVMALFLALMVPASVYGYEPDDAAHDYWNGFPSLPSTYYGQVLSSTYFIPTPEMTPTAWIDERLCGQGRLQVIQGQMMYAVDVLADDGQNACGTPGKLITFKIDSQLMYPTAVWDNAQLWSLPLRPITSPHAVDDTGFTLEDTPVTLSDVLSDDLDPDEGDSLIIAQVSQPMHGSTAISGAASIMYTPTANWNGIDAFDYTAQDSFGLTGTARITITVTAVNDPPDAIQDNLTLAEDSGANTLDVLSNDSFAPDSGETLSIVAVGAASHGAVTFNSSLITYTPAANYFGGDVFTYTISDGNGGLDSASVMIDVTSVNDAPVAVNDVYTTPQDTPLMVVDPGVLTAGPKPSEVWQILLVDRGVLGNDSDIEGTPLSALLIAQPAHGTVGLNYDGTLTYIPDAGYVGQDSFDYIASDGELTDTAQVTIIVTPVNKAPVALNDIGVTREDEALAVPAPGVLDNDSDPNGDPLAVELLTAPITGNVILAADGAYTYTPPPNLYGIISFTYRLSDTGGLSSTAIVYILIEPVNDAPVLGVIGDKDVDELVELAFTATATDIDIPAQTLTFTLDVGSVGSMDGGTGRFTWTPTEAQGPRTYTATVHVSDGELDAAETFTITVNEVNTTPCFTSTPPTTATQAIPYTYAVTAVDTDLPANVLTITAPVKPAWLTLTPGGNGTATLGGTPTSADVGKHLVTLQVRDGGSLADTQSFTLTVSAADVTPLRIYLPLVTRNA